MKLDPQDSGDAIRPPEAGMRAIYIRVVVLEVAVLLALWALSRTFGA